MRFDTLLADGVINLVQTLINERMIVKEKIGGLFFDLINGDTLIKNEHIKSGSVDLILTDLPYGNMNTDGGRKIGINGWDLAIEPKKVFEIANRILRKNGKIILFSQEPYTTKLITEAISNVPFNYRATWEKDNFAVALGAKVNMVSFTEDILMFSKHFESENNDDNPCKKYAVKVFDYLDATMKYLKEFYGNNNLSHFYSSGKQFRLCTEPTYDNLINDFQLKNMDGFLDYEVLKVMNRDYKDCFKSTFNLWEGNKYKSNILKYKKDYTGHHPTQKPVLLLEDLIKTFSNENDLVVDLTMGSGSTGVACKNTNRNFIGIEKDENYFNIAVKRIKGTEPNPNNFEKVEELGLFSFTDEQNKAD
jgi:site-specific DNA-methyltransferase (adenine-specific)